MSQALTISNLRKTYSDGFEALSGVSLSVNEGDFFALLGPNGAGKSTLIGIITSLVRKSSGQVKVFGNDIDTHLREAQSCVGVVTQEFNFNVYERVEDILYNQAGFYGIPRKASRHNVEYYLKKLSLWDKRDKPAGSLSGGMKRRLMVARAMIHDPKLLILDEPTAGVDLEIRLAMWEFIKEMNESRGTTVILTTHYLEEAENLCNNIAVINHGSIIEQTSMQHLLSQLETEEIVLHVNEVSSLPDELVQTYALKVRDAQTIEACIHKHQSVTQLLVALEQCGITVTSMRNKANRLESLFLRLIQSQETPCSQ